MIYQSLVLLLLFVLGHVTVHGFIIDNIYASHLRTCNIRTASASSTSRKHKFTPTISDRCPQKQSHSLSTRPQYHHYLMMVDPYQIASSVAITNMDTSISGNDSNLIDVDSSVFMLSKEAAVIVFVIGIVPFIIATYEFWRRIAISAPFGTGTDSVTFPNNSVVIGEDDAPASSRGKQLLGQDSLITAYIIFATVAVVLGIVLYAVVTSPPPI
jgi:hypothetical protein